MQQNKSKFFFIAMNGLIALLGSILIYYATQWGTWGYSDSATYLGAARSLAAGNGFIINKSSGGIYLYRLFPPFYPIVLSFAYFITGNIFITARAINILVFGIFLFITGWILFLGTKNPLFSLAGPAFLLVSPMMIENFSGAMTEPLFFMILVLFILFEYLYLLEPSVRNFIFLSIFLSLLPFTRYVGVIFLISNFIILIGFTKERFIQRIKKTTIISILGFIPIGGWLLHVYATSSQIAGRRAQLPQAFIETFVEGVRIIPGLLKDFLPYTGRFEEIIPSSDRLLIFSVVYILLIGSAIFLILQREKKEETDAIRHADLLIMIVLHLIFFLFFIPLSYSLTERSYVIDHRILSPIIPLVISTAILALFIVYRYSGIPRELTIMIAWLVAAVILRYNFFQTRTDAVFLHENGRGFSSREYLESGIIDVIKDIPSDTILISNSSGFVLYHDNRLPQQVDQFHARMYGTGPTSSERIFREGKAALIIFIPDFYNYYGNQAENSFAELTDGLVVAYQDPVSAVYYYPQPAESLTPP